ncbi:TFIIE alpha-domain-containing protein [Salix suchowensis]|nr:TFIIE alpha-domain-containing protein [Salix suchowensis]
MWASFLITTSIPWADALRQELEHKGYICTQCRQSYSPLDVDKLMDTARGEFVCEICHGEVVDNENAASVIGSKDRMQRFNNQMRFIRDGLQKSEEYYLWDLTALGVKEHAREQAAGTGSNDDILRGLGVIGGSKSDQTAIVVEDVKPVINHEADCNDYDQYYASLAASASASAQATPSATSAPWSDFGDAGNDEEEDVKPSVQYLDSLNDYRKRSRSREDEGAATKSKLAKTDFGIDLPYVDQHLNNGNGISNDVPSAMNGTQDDDPLVYVNGKPIPYSRVTEEDHDLMTPDEYTAFFEVMQARS